MPTEKQKQQMDDVFNEPLSDRRGKKPPKDYNPPVFEEGESFEQYMARKDAYDAGYYASHKK